MQTFNMFPFFSFWRVHWNMYFAWASRVCLKWTIALDQMYFQQGWLPLVKLCISPKKDQPRTPGRDFFVQCPGLIFLAARWSGPATSASIFSAFLDYILRVCQSLRDSFFYLGKLHWFLYLLLSYYYDPRMFIFCSNFVEKVVLNESMAAKMASLVSYLVYYSCISSEFEQIIRKLCWNNKENNLTTTTTNCRVSFTDLYLVFPTNFRIVVLPRTNTLILLEPYCVVLSLNLCYLWLNLLKKDSYEKKKKLKQTTKKKKKIHRTSSNYSTRYQ